MESEEVLLPLFKDSSDFLEKGSLSRLTFGSLQRSGFFLFTHSPVGNSRRSVSGGWRREERKVLCGVYKEITLYKILKVK